MKTIQVILWFLSFVFLCIAAVTGIGASINYLPTEWFAVCIISIAAVASCASWADRLGIKE